jgi:serine protease AprX
MRFSTTVPYLALAAIVLTAMILAGCGRSLESTAPDPRTQAGSACAKAYAEAGKLLQATGVVIGGGLTLGQPGRLLLAFGSDAQRDAAASQLKGLAISGELPLRTVYAYRHLPIVLVDASRVSDTLIGTLRDGFSANGLLSIYPDRRLDLLLLDSAEFTGAAYARNRFGLDGQGVGVAVIDSGVNELQGDFANLAANFKVVGNPCYGLGGECEGPASGQNLFEFIDLAGTNTDTSSGHGTHVAGIVGGTGAMSGGRIQGMAPGATLVSFAAGEGVAIFVAYALASYDFIIENRDRFNLRVINNSYGGGNEGGGFQPFDPISIATKRAHDAGIIPVFAAGNAGDNGSSGATSSMISHAASPCVISVAAGISNAHIISAYNSIIHDNEIAFHTNPSWMMDSGDARGQLGWFSSRGKKDDAFDHPDITAPGDFIVSAYAGPTALAMFAGVGGPYADADVFIDPATLELSVNYWRTSGTSMAAPHIAGIIALLLQARPELTLDQVLEALQSTAVPMVRTDGTPYEKWEAGAGFVNVDGALARVHGVARFPDQTFERIGTFNGEVGQSATIPLVEVPLASGESSFDFILPAGQYQRLEVFVNWDNPFNDLDVIVTDPDGVSWTSGNPPGLFETVFVEEPLPGTYTVRVYGYLNADENFTAQVVAYRYVVR